MRKSQTTARLALRKQTLRALSVRELSRVAGGWEDGAVYFWAGDGSGSAPPPDDTSMSQGPLGQSGCCNCM